jgi:hypothetical protein
MEHAFVICITSELCLGIAEHVMLIHIVREAVRLSAKSTQKPDSDPQGFRTDDVLLADYLELWAQAKRIRGYQSDALQSTRSF